jgi:hypothetical protein
MEKMECGFGQLNFSELRSSNEKHDYIYNDVTAKPSYFQDEIICGDTNEIHFKNDCSYDPLLEIDFKKLCKKESPQLLLGFSIPFEFSEHFQSIKSQISNVYEQLLKQDGIKMKCWYISKLHDTVKKSMEDFCEKCGVKNNEIPPKFIITMEKKLNFDALINETSTEQIKKFGDFFQKSSNYMSLLNSEYLKIVRKAHVVFTLLGIPIMEDKINISTNDQNESINHQQQYMISKPLFRKTSGILDCVVDHHGQGRCIKQTKKQLPITHSLFHGNIDSPFQFTLRGKNDNLVAFATGPNRLLPFKSDSHDTLEFATTTMKYEEM